MNKKFLGVIMLIVVLTGLVILYFRLKTGLSEITKIIIANGNPTLLNLAAKKGFFKEEGVQVQFKITTPEDDGLSALLTGEIDYATFYGGLFSRAFIETSLRGAPIKTIMLTLKHPVYFLIARPGLELNDIKTIGIHSRYGVLHYQTLKFIEEKNLEIKIITPETGKAFWTGKELINLLFDAKVDAVLNSYLFYTRPKEFPILATFTYTGPSGLVTRNNKIEKNPEEVKKVIRALKRTLEFITTNPKETKEFMLRDVFSLEKTEEMPQATIEDIYLLTKSAADRKNNLNDEGAELLIKLIKAGEFETVQEVEEQVVTQEELDKVFDFRFVK